MGDVMKRHGVTLAVVFGSQVTGSRHPGSDVDVGVLFSNPEIIRKNPVEVYDDLRRAFAHHFGDRNIDIVYLQEAPLSLQYKAARDGEALFESTRAAFADFKEQAMKKYFDFKYFEDIFNAPLLGARLSL
jgi:predicted nucleotidyltransferase